MRGSLLVLLFACDSNAPAVDARTSVSDIVTLDYATMNPARAIFLAPDDTLIADIALPGPASAAMPLGGSVSVFIPDLGGRTNRSGVTTFLDVKPGDQLVGLRAVPPVTINVTIPALAGATSYAVSSPCATLTTTSSTTFPLFTHCNGATTDFNVVAHNGTTLIGAFLTKNVAIAPSISLPGTYMAPRPASLEVANIPAEYTRADVGYMVATSTGFPLGPGLTALDAPVVANKVVVTGDVQDVGENGMHATWTLKDTVTMNRQQVLVSGTTDSSETIDATQYLVPFPTQPVLDASTARMSWAETGPGSANLVEISMTLSSGPRETIWVLGGLHTGMTIRIPSLPAAYAAHNVTPTTTTTGINVITLARSSDPDLVRTSAFTRWLPVSGYFIRALPYY